MRAYVDGEIADSRQITLEEHLKQRTPLMRIRWGIAYFVVAVMDYSVSRRLNFGFES
jgi:cardiolipin synthase